VCVSVHIYIYIYIYIHTHTQTHIHTHIYVQTGTGGHTQTAQTVMVASRKVPIHTLNADGAISRFGTMSPVTVRVSPLVFGPVKFDRAIKLVHSTELADTVVNRQQPLALFIWYRRFCDAP